MELQLTFTEPLAVSQGEELDVLYINIKEDAKYLFTSASSLDYVQDGNLEIRRPLIRQLPKGLSPEIV